MTNVQRAGINFGEESYYGPSWYHSNVLQKPGFEPVESGRVVEGEDPTPNSFWKTSNAHF
jgi:hypothetical protein